MMLKDHILGFFVKSIPRRVLSQLIGTLVFKVFPEPLRTLSLRVFVWKYKINLNEAEFELSAYPSIGDLFIRKLKKQVRPMAQDSYVHPCDAEITQFGYIKSGQLIQVKGWTYSVANFLGSEEVSSKYEGGGFITYYLCPTDYHRVHSPVTGQIAKSCHVVGDLWPVNNWSVSAIHNLFAINERVITYLETPKGQVCAVMVGATNVGKMVMAYDSKLVTNQRSDNSISPVEFRNKSYDPAITIDKGNELGTFYMGSTVIMLFTKESLPEKFEKLKKQKVKMGQGIDS